MSVEIIGSPATASVSDGRAPAGVTLGMEWVRRRDLIVPAATLVVLAGAEEVLSRSGLINATKFPPVSAVLATLAQEVASGSLWDPLWHTLVTWLVSLALSFAGALVLGILIGTSEIVRALLAPILSYLRPIPSTALIPLVILALGANMQGAVFLTVFGTIWQILPMVVRGFSTVDPVSSDTARAFGFTRWQRLRWLTLPSMEPYLLTALRIGASAALVLLVGMELLVGISGIGHKISLGYDGANLKLMYAYILVAGLLGTTINRAIARLVEARTKALHGGSK